jgi:hypothetical protein
MRRSFCGVFSRHTINVYAVDADHMYLGVCGQRTGQIIVDPRCQHVVLMCQEFSIVSMLPIRFVDNHTVRTAHYPRNLLETLSMSLRTSNTN